MRKTLLRCDLTRLPTDATVDMFAPRQNQPQFRLGDITIALRWISRNYADMFIRGRHHIGLIRAEAIPPAPDAKGEWRGWLDTAEFGRRRINGRLVRYSHLWKSEKYLTEALPKAGDPSGAHHYELSWPLDHGGGMLQIEVVRPGPRNAPIPQSQLDDILSAFTISPTLSGHVISSRAGISDGILDISGDVLPKIVRRWGTIQPHEFDGGPPSWNIRFSGLDRPKSILAPSWGATLDEQFASVTRFADRWDATLSRLAELLLRGAALLIEVQAGYGEPVEDLATLDHSLFFDFKPPTEDDDPEEDDPDNRLRLFSDVDGRDSDDVCVLSGQIEIDAAGNLSTWEQ